MALWAVVWSLVSCYDGTGTVMWLRDYLKRFVSEPVDDNIFVEESYESLDKKVRG